MTERSIHSPDPSAIDDGPDADWVRRTRGRVLAATAGKRRRRRGLAAGWIAGVPIAAMLALLFTLSGSDAGFAQVRQSIHRTRTLQCRSTILLRQGAAATPISTARSWADNDLGARLDIDALGLPLAQVWLPLNGRPMLVDHTHRAVIPIALPDSLAPRELLRFDPASLVRQLSSAVGEIELIQPDDPLNAEAEAGWIGFRVPPASMGLSPDSTLMIWADRDTHLPARIIATVPLDHDAAVVWTLDAFLWDQPIELDQLVFTAPAGYEPIEPLTIPPPGEEALARTLQRFALVSDGRFPTSQMPGWEAMVRLLTVALRPVAAWSRLPQPLRSDRGQRDSLGEAVAGGLFLMQLHESGAQPLYTGQTARLGDDATLLSWRSPDGQTHRITAHLTDELNP